MLIFTVNILPEPQKRTRFVMRGKYPHAYNPSAKYQELIQWQLKPYAPSTPLLGPLEIDYSFYLPIPKSISGIRAKQMLNGMIKHIKRPDASNLHYIFENAMKGIIYEDDNQICDYHVHKQYDYNPRTVIKVIELSQMAVRI